MLAKLRGVVLSLLMGASFFLGFHSLASSFLSSACSYKAHNGRSFHLWGRVQVVHAFPDLKVKVVSAFPDLRVKVVQHKAHHCGRWRFVNHFPDFKIQFVDSFPDITIAWDE